MKSKYWYYLFFTDALAELTAIAAGWDKAALFTKPLLILLLLTWLMASSIKFSPLRYCIAAALFFSWMGDVFLMLETKAAGWFMAGLCSFLLAHLLYILFFLRVRRTQLLQPSLKPFLITIVAAYVIVLFIFLYPRIGKLKLPVAIYACTIGIMLLTALHAFDKSRANAAGYCITGAVLFVISDSLLAINKFYYAFPVAGFCIMLTYSLAQFAITKGSLLYLAAEKAGLLKTDSA